MDSRERKNEKDNGYDENHVWDRVRTTPSPLRIRSGNSLAHYLARKLKRHAQLRATTPNL